MNGIRDLLNKLPEFIDNLLASLEEQKKDTTPDEETADYFKDKKEIDNKIKSLQALRKKISDIK